MWSVSLAEHLQASTMCTAQATWREVCRWQNTYRPAPCALRRPLDVKCVAGRTLTGQLHVHCAGHLMWSVSLAEHLQASSMCTAQATWCEVCRWQNTYRPAPCALHRPRDVKCVAGRTLTSQLHVHCTGHLMWSVSLAEHLQASTMCTAQATWCEVCRWQNSYRPALLHYKQAAQWLWHSAGTNWVRKMSGGNVRGRGEELSGGKSTENVQKELAGNYCRECHAELQVSKCSGYDLHHPANTQTQTGYTISSARSELKSNHLTWYRTHTW